MLYKQPLLIIFSAFLGLLLGMYTFLGSISILFVEIFLMLLLFIVFISIDFRQFIKASSNIKYTATSIVINFIIIPIIAYLLALIFFNNSIPIRMGLVMLLVTPCTDWYLVFTKLTRGNVELNMTILPINLLLQVLLLPLYLYIFFGNSIELNVDKIFSSIAIVLIIPLLCALFTKIFIKNNIKVRNFIQEHSDNLQLLFLSAAVFVMFASEGKNLLNNYMLLLRLFIPLLCFFTLSYFITKIISRFIVFPKDELISLHFTTLARNSPLALAIAVSAFPHEPLISLSLIIGPLLELPILSIISTILLKKHFQGQ